MTSIWNVVIRTTKKKHHSKSLGQLWLLVVLLRLVSHKVCGVEQIWREGCFNLFPLQHVSDPSLRESPNWRLFHPVINQCWNACGWSNQSTLTAHSTSQQHVPDTEQYSLLFNKAEQIHQNESLSLFHNKKFRHLLIYSSSEDHFDEIEEILSLHWKSVHPKPSHKKKFKNKSQFEEKQHFSFDEHTFYAHININKSSTLFAWHESVTIIAFCDSSWHAWTFQDIIWIVLKRLFTQKLKMTVSLLTQFSGKLIL